MRKVVIGEFLTLDGVRQTPGGAEEDTEGDFKHGGWQMPYFDEESGKIMDEAFAKVDGLLLGRKTYDIFAGYWPNAPVPAPSCDTMWCLPEATASPSTSPRFSS